MKISYNEIWNFIDLVDKDDHQWSYTLHAAGVSIKNISQKELLELKSDQSYDTELLPSLFTFREILWQPDVFTEAAQSLPGLRILKAFCEETAAEYKEHSSESQLHIYAALIMGLAKNCENAIGLIEAKKEGQDVSAILGDLRTKSFPIIKFFIYHPQNRLDYYRDAVNRLNYAVKIILTEFHGRYTELEDPYWDVNYQKSPPPTKKPTKEKSQDIK